MIRSLPVSLRSLGRAVLAGIFLLGQSAVALHHHDAAATALTARRVERGATAISDGDDCTLCSYQAVPRVSAPVAVAVAVAASEVVVLSSIAWASPRDARPGRVRARAPPAA